MDKKLFDYKWLKIINAILDDELCDIVLTDLEHNRCNDLLEEINEKILMERVRGYSHSQEA